MRELIRWPHVREQLQCVLCGQPKQPSILMCIDCFQQHHVSKAQYDTATERALNRAENNLFDDDPWTAALEGIERIIQ